MLAEGIYEKYLKNGHGVDLVKYQWLMMLNTYILVKFKQKMIQLLFLTVHNTVEEGISKTDIQFHLCL